MSKLAILSILTLIFSSCQEQEQPTRALESVNKIVGSWKMVYAEIEENDSVNVKDLKHSEFVKFINNSHFAFINQDYTNPNGFYAGGGTYKLVDNQYTETLSYTSVDAVRGHSFPFTIEFKGDTLMQFGLEEIKEANIKRNILEKYIRIID